MDTSTMLIIAAAMIIVIGGLYYYFYQKEKKGLAVVTPAQNDQKVSMQLKLQAYERLVLLTDRISLPNLISRLNQPDLSAKDMQLLLTQSIRQEFEHNITQQIYVTPEAWDAVRNLKEQNLLIINQVTSFLPGNATGNDLNKSLMELMMQNPKASLHNIVADALSYEAKKLMEK